MLSFSSLLRGCAGALLLSFALPALHAEEKPPAPREYWLDLYSGEESAESAMVADLTSVDVVYAGEIHTLDRHHATQAYLLRKLIEAGGPVALGLEQVEVTDQPALDRFNRKELDFDAFAKEIDWAKKWRNFEQYRELCELAQEHGVEVIALNAPAKIVRQVGRQGLATLPKEEREQLPKEINTDDPIYARLMNLLLSVHASIDPEKLQPIFEAQVVRDESMAEQVVRALETPEGKPRKVLVICGRGHISYGLGIPDRVHRRKAGVRDRIVLATESGELKLSKSEEKMRREVKISHDDLRSLGRPLGDYLHVMPRQ